MKLSELFEIAYGHKLDMNKMTISDRTSGVAFVGRRGGNQGISGYIARIDGLEPYPTGTITVALGGSFLLSAFVQQSPFYTAQNVAVLKPVSPDMPLKHRLFYAMCIRENRFRYSAFGREANRTLSDIEVPDNVPKWVDSLEMPTHDGLQASLESKAELTSSETWGQFEIGHLFTVKKGRRVTRTERSPGSTRFIGASERNNGVTDHCDLPPIFPENVITVPYNGNSVGWAFYQDKPFFACDDVNVLIPKDPMSKWVLLFVCAVLKHGKQRYTYGYKWTKTRMESTSIRIPLDNSGGPDFAYMENVMKGLPFSSALELGL